MRSTSILSVARSSSILAVLLLGLVACGGGDGDPANVADATDDLITASCEKAFECKDSFPPGDEVFESMIGSDVAECKTNLAEELSPSTGIQAAVDAGRVVFHSDRVGACIDGIEGTTCEALWEDGPDVSACQTVFEGTIADDAACTIDEECISQSCSSIDGGAGTCEADTSEGSGGGGA